MNKKRANVTTLRPMAALVGLCVLMLSSAPALAWELFEEYHPNVVVSDPFIEMRTGPGRGFPIFYVAGQGEEIPHGHGRAQHVELLALLPGDDAGALVLGEQELSEGRIGLKPLRSGAEQENIALDQLAAVLKERTGGA